MGCSSCGVSAARPADTYHTAPLQKLLQRASILNSDPLLVPALQWLEPLQHAACGLSKQ